MGDVAKFLQPSEAARQLGVSTKALRLYERRGLIQPVRTAAGWRTYGPKEMARAAEIIALRTLGLSLGQVTLVLQGDPRCLEAALVAHRADLEGRARRLAKMIARVTDLQADLDQGKAPTVEALKRLVAPTTKICSTFTLPWPWGGERFALRNIRSINYITGPLGSGKGRLARKIAESLPDARYLEADRSVDGGIKAREQMAVDNALKSRVEQASDWLLEDGAVISTAMITLLAALATDDNPVLVIDVVEQGLDQPSQEALMAYLRRRQSSTQALFLLTRSNAILDLDLVGGDETIILCPANHSPPIQVLPYPGTPGYEAVETCLASPDVRARTEGLTAARRRVA
ncbi:MAG: MerR family transcriptional regulator [Pseudomonadota bacterium]